MRNPFYFIIDLPWVLGMLIITVIAPWRLLTTYRYLSKHHEHFPNWDKQPISHYLLLYTLKHSLRDYYISIPLVLGAILNPFNIPCLLSLYSKNLSYAVYEDFDRQEQYRRQVLIMLTRKSFNDYWTYIVMMVMQTVSLYYVPMLWHLYKHREIYPKPQDLHMETLKTRVSAENYEALKYFDSAALFIHDSMFPVDFRFAIRLLNQQLYKTIRYLPLLPCTFLMNPYRSYQFFWGTKGLEFVQFTFESKVQVMNMEDSKRRMTVHCFSQSLTDFLAFIATLVIGLTGFRTMYLLAILSVNGHLSYYNPFLKRSTKSMLLIIKL